MEKTFAIIKPDAVRMGGGVIGQIISMAATAGLHPVEMEMGELGRLVWERFYGEHVGKPFFDELVDFMNSGPSIFLVLEGKFAIKHWRVVMGATDPLKADVGTIRRMFGNGGPANAVHGSDSSDAVYRERAIVELALRRG